MLPWKRKKKTQPKTDREALDQAFKELAEEEEGRAKRRDREERKGWRRYLGWLDRRVLWGLLIILVLLVADGVRRQNAEFFAEVHSLTGDVTLTNDDGDSLPADEGTKLTSGATVVTGPGGRVVLELHDGTRLVVVEGSDVELTGLDYNRGGDYRDHSFTVRQGRLMASVSNRFGAESELAVGTPGAVAAVRGTVFLVDYEPGSGASRAACQDGMVHLSANGFVSQPVTQGAMAYADAAGNLSGISPLPSDLETAFLGTGELSLPPSEDPLMQRIEYPLNRLLDPVLSVLGIGRSSWAILAGNAARRAAAMEAGQDIWQDLESQAKVPPRVTLTTMDELTLPERKREAVLDQLAGNRLEGYVAGSNSYVVLFRAKDRERTPFMVTPSGVENVKDDDQAVAAALRACGYRMPEDQSSASGG
ncbi:MAG: hypothetical protein GF320_03970 [Armatimonadia bacterium]|nr:hypothetical protein [Armatimonadia bacterium]